MIKQFRDTNYYCTPYGEIYRKKKDGSFNKCNPSADKFGYRFMTVMMNDSKKVMKAHRIIFEAWCGPILNGLTIDHVDFNPSNNNISNLRLMTKSENSKKKQRSLSGTNSVLAKLTHEQVIEIYSLRDCKRGDVSKIASRYGVTRSTINRIFAKEAYALNLAEAA